MPILVKIWHLFDINLVNSCSNMNLWEHLHILFTTISEMLAYINNIVSTIGLKWAANWNFQDWLTVGGGGLPIFQTPHEVPLTTLKSTKNILTNFTKSPNLFTRGFQKGDEHFFYEGVPKSSFYQNHHHHYHHHDPLLVQEALHQLYFHSNQILTVKLFKGTFSCLIFLQIWYWSFLFGSVLAAMKLASRNLCG